jgi:hypothetical protein
LARHAEALEELAEALDLARRADVGPVQTWALAFSGRSHLLCCRYDVARQALAAALELARGQRWAAFVSLREAAAAVY